MLLPSQLGHKRRGRAKTNCLSKGTVNSLASSAFLQGVGEGALSECTVHKRNGERLGAKKKGKERKTEKNALHLLCPSSVQKGVFLSTFFTL